MSAEGLDGLFGIACLQEITRNLQRRGDTNDQANLHMKTIKKSLSDIFK